jgi:hypothetical protein
VVVVPLVVVVARLVAVVALVVVVGLLLRRRGLDGRRYPDPSATTVGRRRSGEGGIRTLERG